MADGTLTEEQLRPPQIPPQLRQRMLSRAATSADGPRTTQTIPPRRSSMLSDRSDISHSPRSSITENNRYTDKEADMDSLASSRERDWWMSLAIAFPILPAVCGLFFEKGSLLVTDTLLLFLGFLFLYWCSEIPWGLYQDAREVEYVEGRDDRRDSFTLIEEEEEGEEDEASPGPANSDSAKQASRSIEDIEEPRMQELESARRALSRQRFWALLGCFAGPVLGGYLVHELRSHLSRPSEGLVSNANLTIFIIIAEIRPVRQLIKVQKGHIDRIQRTLRRDFDPSDRLTNADAKEISQRMADIEAKLAVPTGGNSTMDAKRVSADFKQSIQSQLDALNRAVRRYEKRQTAQEIQIEARFADIEVRLKDALALAAAAARTGQQPGIVSMALIWITSLFTSSLQTVWAVVSFPFSVAASLVGDLKSWVFPRRRSRKRMQTRNNLHSSLSTARVQSGMGR